MANIYVRSTDGNDADNGSTWALAKATLAGAAAIDAAGDTIYVSQAHAETPAANTSYSFAGTHSNPVKIICGNDGVEPPTAISTSATITCGAGNYTFTINGSFYCYGLSLTAGSVSNGGHALGNAPALGEVQMYEKCQFKMAATGASAYLYIGSTASEPPFVTFKDCDVSFGVATSGVGLATAKFVWNGGSILAGSVALTSLFKSYGGGRVITALVSGVDLSNLGATAALVTAGSVRGTLITFRNCKLPASWSGVLFSGTFTPLDRIEMYDCDNADTNYRLWIEDYNGSIKHETTLVKTGGASDGTTGLSWKMATSAAANYPTSPLESGEIAVWNDTTGAAKTLTVDILHDSVTNLTDAEVWLDVQYLGTVGFPLGNFISDAKADVLAAAAAQTASSATWTTTGMTNPNKQKLSVTLTPQKKGYYIAKVKLAAASKTIYVDPAIVVT